MKAAVMPQTGGPEVPHDRGQVAVSSINNRRSTPLGKGHSRQLAQPGAQDRLTLLGTIVTISFGIGTQLRHRHARCRRNLASVTDQPALKPLLPGLGMELERQNMTADGKGLMIADICRSQVYGARRQIECVPVPVQNRLAFKGSKRLFSFTGKCQGFPADFLGAAGINARTHGAGDQLRTQADAQQWLSGGKLGRNKRKLGA